MRLPIHSKEAPGHRKAEELLPWYVNGTLEGEELEGVELHLADCELCRAEIAQQRRLARALRTSEKIAFSPERSFEQLRGGLEEESEREGLRGEESPGGLLRRWRRSLHDLAVPVRWALAAQLVVILALAAALGWRASGQVDPAAFRTLTERPAIVAGEAPRLRVIFDAGASESDLRELLLGANARIVDGPSSFGVYTIEVADERAGRALQALRSSDLVVFAEPVSETRDARP